MTKTMHFPLAATGFDWSALTTPVVTLLLGGGGGGILMAWLDRRSKRDDAIRADNKDAHKDDATVQTKKLELDDTERTWYREELRKNDEKREAQATELRAEMRGMRRTFGHEIRTLQQYNTAVLDFYHAQHATLNMVVLQCRIMRARLKKIQKEEFDEAEFPEIDITFFDPKNLPRLQVTNGWDEPEPDPKKGTVRLDMPSIVISSLPVEKPKST